jgi:hypothetical protein
MKEVGRSVAFLSHPDKGVLDETPALAIGGGKACDEQGVTECGQIVPRHQHGIGDLDVSPWSDSMFGQERRDVRQERVIHRFI